MNRDPEQTVAPSDVDTAVSELMSYEVEDVEVDENPVLETGCLSCS